MPLWLRHSALRPSAGSAVERWMSGRALHPDAFDCGVRVLSGAMPGESARWSFRASAVDPLIIDDVVTLQHGKKATLRLTIDDVSHDALEPDTNRHGHVIVPAVEHGTGACLQISVGLGELGRFGIETPL